MCFLVVYLYDETLCISLGAHKPNRVSCPLCYMDVAMATIVRLHVHACSICNVIIYYCTLHWYHISINLISLDLIWFGVIKRRYIPRHAPFVRGIQRSSHRTRYDVCNALWLLRWHSGKRMYIVSGTILGNMDKGNRYLTNTNTQKNHK